MTWVVAYIGVGIGLATIGQIDAPGRGSATSEDSLSEPYESAPFEPPSVGFFICILGIIWCLGITFYVGYRFGLAMGATP